MEGSPLRKFFSTIAAIFAAAAIAAPAAQATPANALQPSNVYFGVVKAGKHPTRVVTVRNRTGRAERITRFLIGGSGGMKFTLVGKAGSSSATCHVGTVLANRTSCTIIVRVKTTRPEFWQSAINVFYAHQGKAAEAGQWNGGVYAHVVA